MTRGRGRSIGWQLAGLPVLAVIAGACGYVPGLPPAVDMPAGAGHRMSIDQVQQAVQMSVAKDAQALGRVLRPFHVTSLRLVAPFEPVGTAGPDGHASSMTFSTDTTSWVVHAQGTFRDCASTCMTYTEAVLVVDDARGVIVGREADGPMTLDATTR